MEKEKIETTNVETAVAEQPAVATPEVATPAPETPAQPETPVADTAKPKTTRTRTTKKETAVDESAADVVNGVELDVVGEAIHSNKGASQYRVTVKIPRRENYGLYLKEAILMELRKADLLYSGVATWNVDRIEKITVPVSFIGKDVFDLSREECFMAKAYYGLGGFQCFDGDLRTVQKEIYRRFATFFHIDNGASEEYLKWENIVLKRMVCPQGDTVIPEELPVAFDDFGDTFRKTFRKAEK
jgi:hypothetical protein